MNKVKFFENKAETSRIDFELERLKPKIQTVCDEWYKLSIGYLESETELNMNTLRTFYSQSGKPMPKTIENYLREKKAAILKPKYTDFGIEMLKAMFDQPPMQALLIELEMITPDQYWNAIVIKSKKVGTIPYSVEQLKAIHIEHAETPEQLNRLEMVEDVQRAMQKIMDTHPYIKPAHCKIDDLLFENSGELCISYHFVKYGRFNGALAPGDKVIGWKVDATDNSLKTQVQHNEGMTITEIAERRNKLDNPADTIKTQNVTVGNSTQEIAERRNARAI